MPPVGFEPTNPLGEQPQTNALDRVATGTGKVRRITILKTLRVRNVAEIAICQSEFTYHFVLL